MSDPMSDMFDLFEPRTFSGPGGETMPYRLMKPKDLDPAKVYPLLLFLHGSGGNGNNNRGNLTDTATAALMASDEWREAHPAFVLAPHCPVDHSWAKNVRRGGFPEVKHLVLGILDEVIGEFNVDTDRIYVTGLSRGGFGAFGMVVERPDTFAAAVPVCGGWEPADAEKVARVPFWVFHGGADPIVDTDFSRNMVGALEDAGATVKYTEYPGVGHDCWTRAYGTAEMWTWMFEQRKA